MRDEVTVINQNSLSGEAVFYTIKDIEKMTGWSSTTVQKLFNTKDFPYCDFGRHKIVESHALIAYFSKRRTKDTDRFWNEGVKKNEQRTRRTRNVQGN